MQYIHNLRNAFQREANNTYKIANIVQLKPLGIGLLLLLSPNTSEGYNEKKI